jgi:AraC-like DNA-binding protein
VEGRFQNIKIPNATRISGACELGTTLFHLATSLYQQAGVLTLEEGAAAIEAYLEVLSACLGHSRSELQGNDQKEPIARIIKYINLHLTDNNLSPAEIATAAGISVRHLHRLFSRRFSSVADWIWVQRLERCWRDLSDPRLRQKSITEIAFFWGFNDSAHFSHSFKRQFGICPRSFRSSHLQESWEAENRERAMHCLDSSYDRHARAS